MTYATTDALYDMMSIQVPVSLIIALVLSGGFVLENVRNAPIDILVAVSFVIFIWFCFSLLFFFADLLVIAPIFWILRGWNRLYRKGG